MRIYILIILFLLTFNDLFGQEGVSKSKLEKIVNQIDSLTKGEYGRSAFLDRGLDENSQLYDSLVYVYFEELEKYLKVNNSLINIEDILIKSVDLIEANNKRIFQWEYISGGSQEETHKIIQVLHADSIQVYKDVGSRTYGLYYFNNAFLEFQSIKGCSTCCEERISYNNEEIFNISYRCNHIDQMFTFNRKNQTIEVKIEDKYIEVDNNEGYEVLNKNIMLYYDGSKFNEKNN